MSTKKKIVLVFEFDEVAEDEDYTYLDLSKIRLGKSTTLSDDERDAVTESWGQSDEWHVNIYNDILHVIDTGDSVRYG